MNNNMDDIQHFFASVESRAFHLNASGTRELKICFKSIAPSIDFVFKLTAIDHRCHIEFSKETWNEIVDRSEEIQQILENEKAEEIFNNSELRLFTEERHGKCALCFVDLQGQRVNMMKGTFANMMSKSSSISDSYQALLKDIKKIATVVDTFINTMSFKCKQYSVKNEAYCIYLRDLQNGIKKLLTYPNFPSLAIDLNQDYNDEFDDYEYYRRYRRRF